MNKNAIRELRIARAWSQEQLAEMAGLSVRTVQRAENGAPSGLETLKALAAVFEVSLDSLRSDVRNDDEFDAAPTPPSEETAMQTQELATATNATRERNRIIHRSMTLVMVLAMLTLINYMTSPGYFWVQWPALGFGVAILGMWAGWFASRAAEGSEKSAVEEWSNSPLGVTLILAVALCVVLAVNLMTNPSQLWVKWPALGISIAVGFVWIRHFGKSQD